MALAMIEGAERSGRLRPGQTVVEYTGGSTGPALAFENTDGVAAPGDRPRCGKADYAGADDGGIYP